MRNSCLRPSSFALFAVLGLLATFPTFSALGSTLLWEANHQIPGITAGDRVNGAGNPWWVSSSPFSEFVSDAGQVAIALEPGHELSNSSAIPLPTGMTAGVFELLIRTDDPLTLAVATNNGLFSTSPGGVGEAVLMVPSIYAANYQWIAFQWRPEPEDPSLPAPPSGTAEATLSLFSIDSNLHVAGARFTATSVPEPGRIALLGAGMLALGLRRWRAL